MHWEKLFDPVILQRGQAYDRKGAVTDIRIHKDRIKAVVEGTEEYAVTIDLAQGEVKAMACTCPYAQDGTPCKHMAAVLYAYEKSAPPQPSQPLTCERLLLTVNGADPAQTKKSTALVKKQLNKIVSAFGGKDEFIDYYAARGFIAKIDQWMDDQIDPLLERRQDRAAFDLSIHVMKTLGSVEMDDSDGGITQIADRCYDIWQTILDHGDPTMEEEMFAFFLQDIDGQIVDYLEDFYESILMARFEKPEYLKRKLALYQARLDAVEPASADSLDRYRAGHYVQQLQALMIQLQTPSEELAAFRKKYWAYPSIRKACMEEYKKEGQWEALIGVLQESILLDEQEYPGYARDDHLMLKDAYLQAGQMEAYQEELRVIVTQIMPGNMDLFREYKRQIPQDAWPAKREEVFAAVKGGYLLNPLYSEEMLYDRLLKSVLSAFGLHDLQAYETELLPLYPQKVLEKYVQEINTAARVSTGREWYRDMVNTLRHMRKLPGGREAVQQIVEEWRVLYRRRRAMMEELNKL